MKKERQLYKFLVLICLAFGLMIGVIACGSGGGNDTSPSNTSTSGPIDGTWRIDKKVCNGTNVDIGSAVTMFSITNKTGRVYNQFCDIPVTLSYPGNSSVEWVIENNSCGGAGDRHAATYLVQSTTLTVTEAMTPAGEYGCSSGMQVTTLTKQ